MFEPMEDHTITLKQVIEALVFASPKPLPTREITAAIKAAGKPEQTDDTLALDYAKAKEVEVHALLMELQADYLQNGRAFRLVEQVNGWSLVTDPAAAIWVRQLYPEAKPTRLTGPQLETLAIIAYRQPVTRADIEAVRGVAVDSVMQVLLDRSLVKIAGRAEVPGRPLLYTTTEYFLQHFGLRSTEELPNADELRRVVLPVAPAVEAVEAKSGETEGEGEKEGVGDREGEGEKPVAETGEDEAIKESDESLSDEPADSTPPTES
ncbi:MAG: SMC-Scp complex subunit ScpB [Chthoniobacteraceae bacterium]